MFKTYFIEIWKSLDFLGFPDYEISSRGDVVSHRKGGRPKISTKVRSSRAKKQGPKFLAKKPDPKGYIKVSLVNDLEIKSIRIHVLLAAAFLGECPPDKEVCHLDGVRHHNVLENLAYGTRLENMHDRVIHGTLPVGSRHGNSKYEECDVFMLKICLDNGIEIKEAADIFTMTCSNVRKIKHNKLWCHVPWPLNSVYASKVA